MPVLFIGPYRDGTGWGNAAVDYILALDDAGVEVAARPIKLNDTRAELSDRLLECEARSFDRYDAVIQHVLPHQVDYNGDYPKNIALYYLETSNFKQSNWATRLNLMDEAWVCCHHNRCATITSDVHVPVRVFPVPCDITKYERRYEPLATIKELAGNFIFYTVGEFVHRKNLATLVKAFHLEFDVNEPVSLLIKANSWSASDDYAVKREIAAYCTAIKEGMKIYGKVSDYKPEIILTGRFSDSEIMRLHESCDCGVFVSHGEAWSMPTFDSMAMGKTPIVAAYGGFLDYVDDECGWLVRATIEPAFGTQSDTFPDIHTSRENWCSVDIRDLMRCMREAYERGDLRRQKSLVGVDKAYEFTRKKVGLKMKEALYA